MPEMSDMPPLPDFAKPRVRSETDEEQLGDDYMLRAGFSRVEFSLPMHVIGMTKGVSDRYYDKYGHALWWEAKAAKGQLTRAQHEFLVARLDAGVLAICGTFDDLHATHAVMLGGRISNSLDHCRQLVARWASKGYRKEPTKRPGRPTQFRRKTR
jgi:hypothetical protein